MCGACASFSGPASAELQLLASLICVHVRVLIMLYQLAAACLHCTVPYCFELI